MIKISDGEYKVMEYIWEYEDIKATDLAKLIKEELGWSRTTVYTQLKRLIDKKAIEKIEPSFKCRTKISKESVRIEETNNLINKLYSGSRKMFLSAFLSQEKLSEEELDEIRKFIEKQK